MVRTGYIAIVSVLVLFLATVVAVVTSASLAAFAAGSFCLDCQQGSSSPIASGFLLTLSGQAKVSAAASADVSSGSQEVYVISPVCLQESTSTASLCNQAQKKCGPNFEISPFLVYAGPTVQSAQLLPGVIVCLGPADYVVTNGLGVQVSQEVQRLLRLHPPHLGFNPRTGGIVNVPEIFYASPQAAVAVTAQLAGASVTLTAVPYWTWTFGDGSTQVSTWPGRPYDGVNPASNPGYYVDHTYREPGIYRVSVTVAWVPTYQVHNVVGSFTLAPVQLTTTSDVRIEEATSTLVG